jgi:hypothetical protein
MSYNYQKLPTKKYLFQQYHIIQSIRITIFETEAKINCIFFIFDKIMKNLYSYT